MTPQSFTIPLGLFFAPLIDRLSHNSIHPSRRLQSTYNINNVQHNDTLLFDRIALFGMSNDKRGERCRC
jgi:hypothetical protein